MGRRAWDVLVGVNRLSQMRKEEPTGCAGKGWRAAPSGAESGAL